MVTGRHGKKPRGPDGPLGVQTEGTASGRGAGGRSRLAPGGRASRRRLLRRLGGTPAAHRLARVDSEGEQDLGPRTVRAILLYASITLVIMTTSSMVVNIFSSAKCVSCERRLLEKPAASRRRGGFRKTRGRFRARRGGLAGAAEGAAGSTEGSAALFEASGGSRCEDEGEETEPRHRSHAGASFQKPVELKRGPPSRQVGLSDLRGTQTVTLPVQAAPDGSRAVKVRW